MWKPQTISLAKSYIIRQWILIMRVFSNRTKYQNKPQTAYVDRNPSVVNCSICVPACPSLASPSSVFYHYLICAAPLSSVYSLLSHINPVSPLLYLAVPSLLISLHFTSPNRFMVCHDKNVSWLCEFSWCKFGTKSICKGILLPSE